MASAAENPHDVKSLSGSFEWATKHARLCANRVWSVAGMDLPTLLPPEDKLKDRVDSMESASKSGVNGDSVDQASRELEDHEMCTFDFCENSQRDFTGTGQRHECAKKADCAPLQGLFSRETLKRAAQEDKSTVWSLDGRSMIERPRPHMAISHVWSDGTGTGSWPDGEVNQCLFEYFKQIALQFQCEGIWWDTLCIPKEKAAREKAIRMIQTNYENARITLIHDCFLRNWKWDRETACFAILMSPWFSRGWTALELAKSHKVKVIFKGPYGPVIKDLDEEILAKDDDTGPHKKASEMIKSLRKRLDSIDKLLKILGPRDTSWPKDKAIISALIADVPLQKGPRQQDVYKRILASFCQTRISPGLLFHNSPTMPQVGWCPTNLLNLSIDELEGSQDSKRYLRIENDLSLVGNWTRILASDVPEEHYNWTGTHPLIRQKIKLQREKSPTSTYLLFEKPESVNRALFVNYRILGSTPCYDYIWTVRLHRVLDRSKCEVDVEVKLLGDANLHRNAAGMASEDQNQQPNDHPDLAAPNMDFHDAIWRKDRSRYSICINAINLNEVDELGQQPLHLAAERGDFYMAQQLLNKTKLLDRAKEEDENKDKNDAKEKDKAEEVNLTEAVLNARCNAGQTALHRASWGGSTAVVKLLLEIGANTEIKDIQDNSALHVAAEKGFEPVVDKLLDEGKMDCTAKNRNQNGITPLHLAARSGQEGIVLSFLTRGAEVDATDNYGWSPLHYAAESGQRRIIEVLLDHHATIDLKDCTVGWTPLHFAAINGHESVLTLLLAKKAKIEPDNQGWTPWHFAELKEHSAIVDPLHDEGITVYFDIYQFGWTSLHCAAITEQQVVTTKLLDEDVYSFDKDYQLVLLWAAREGQKAITKLLLDEGAHVDSSPHQPNYETKERTALSWAAGNGHVSVAQLLLDRRAKIDSSDWDGRTPLSWASGNGHMVVVELLLSQMATVDLQEEVKLWIEPIATVDHQEEAELPPDEISMVNEREKRSHLYRTPLSWAAGHGHMAIAELLLNKNADVNSWDSDCRTPLSWAAGNGFTAVVELLLKRSAVVDLREEHTNRHRTPLSWAAGGGDLAMVQLLIQKSAQVDSFDSDGRTPLSWAAGNGHMDVAAHLLDQGAHVNSEGNRGRAVFAKETSTCRTPLSWAAENGHGAMAKLLLDRTATPNSWDRDGRTPLSWAAGEGHLAVAKLLLDYGAIVYQKLPYIDLGTPLLWAAKYGHKAMVELLLDEDAHPDLPDESGKTPLCYAVLYEHESVVELLLDRCKVNVDSKDNSDRTPRMYAQMSNRSGIVKLFEPYGLLSFYS